jgi:hypothetical protein
MDNFNTGMPDSNKSELTVEIDQYNLKNALLNELNNSKPLSNEELDFERSYL